MIRKWMGNQKGLTLIELLAVIVILGVIAAIAVPAIGGTIGRSQANADVQSEDLIEDAAIRYLYDVDPDGDGKTAGGTDVDGYNATAGTLTVTALRDNGYLREVPRSQVAKAAYVSVSVAFNNSTGWTATGVN